MEEHSRKLADDLDRILYVRLREAGAKYPNGPRDALQLAMRWIRKRLGGKPDALPTAPWQWEIIARIRSLPPHLQEALRRYFVFREAEESICYSIDATPREFRRFLRDAADYILMRQERMPELATKKAREETPRDGNSTRPT